VRREFLSTTIDVSLLFHSQQCDWESPLLRTLAASLSPVLLRVGGTQGDTVFYDMGESPASEPPPGYSHVLTASLWSSVASFAAATNMSIVFGLNAGLGPRNGSSFGAWNPDNAATLWVVLQCLEVVCG
jgi:hypothetical protein